MDEFADPLAVYDETQDPPWPLMALGYGAGAAGVVAAARTLSLVARLGIAGAMIGGMGLAFREFLFPMRTTVLPDEIQVRFGRRLRYRIPLRNVVRVYARTYDPLREYGGWGIRAGKHGGAFNMRGNEGVQLEMRSGRKLLIGSQQPSQLEDAIRRVWRDPQAPGSEEFASAVESPNTTESADVIGGWTAPPSPPDTTQKVADGEEIIEEGVEEIEEEGI